MLSRDLPMDKPANIGIVEEFRLEFVKCWERLPNKAWFLVLLVTWLGLFHWLGNSGAGLIKTHSLLNWMYLVCKPNNTADRDDTQGLIAPFVVLGLFWWKRKELLAADLRTWMPGMVIVVFGLFVHILGFRVQQQRISIVGLLTGIYGLMGMSWGPGWLRKSFFPFCLLVFCIPLGTLSQPITFRLRLLVCQIVEFVSQYVLQIDLIRTGTAIKDPTNRFQYEVAPACSGIRSLITTIGLALVYGMVSFRTWWKRALVFASAFPLAVLGNTLRMLAIVVAAEIGGQDWGNKVHDGWPFGISNLIPYFLVFAGLIFLGRWLHAPDKTDNARPAEKAASAQARPGVDTMMPKFASALTLLMILGAGTLLFQFRGEARLGPPGVKTSALAGTSNLEVELPEKVLDYTSEKVPIDDIVFKYLAPDTSYGQRKYTAPDGFTILANVVLMGSDRASIHKPQICLQAAGWQLDSTPPPLRIMMDRPYPYALDVIKLTSTREYIQDGQRGTARGIYVYWFVADGALSADASGFRRMWRSSSNLLRTGTMLRWAYISYFAACSPGEEEATFERIRKLIVASVPEFQLTPSARDPNTLDTPVISKLP